MSRRYPLIKLLILLFLIGNEPASKTNLEGVLKRPELFSLELELFQSFLALFLSQAHIESACSGIGGIGFVEGGDCRKSDRLLFRRHNGRVTSESIDELKGWETLIEVLLNVLNLLGEFDRGRMVRFIGVFLLEDCLKLTSSVHDSLLIEKDVGLLSVLTRYPIL